MAQQDQFSSADLAPDTWVRSIQGIAQGTRQWRDGSWGNNAAPSWELWEGEKVCAEAFYYSVDNVERVTDLFESEPFVTVCLFDRGENVRCAFDVSADTFIRIAMVSAAKPGDSGAALEASAKDVGGSDRICWHSSY